MTIASPSRDCRGLDPPPVLRVASLEMARRTGLRGALALAASLGFETVEIPAAELPDDDDPLDALRDLLTELGLRAGTVSIPWAEVFEADPIAACRRAERLGCHRLAITLDPACERAELGELGRRIDAVGYRLAGRSASLLVRADGRDEARHAVLAGVLHELSQVAVALELEATDGDLFERWGNRVGAIAVSDRMLLDPPDGTWTDRLSPGRRAVDWLAGRYRSPRDRALTRARASAPEPILHHRPGQLGESEALSRGLSRWRHETAQRARDPAGEDGDAERSKGELEARPLRRSTRSSAIDEQIGEKVEKNVEPPLPKPPPDPV